MNSHDPVPGTLSQYLLSIPDGPLLTAKEEQDLARKARDGDHDAREQLILSNLRLVVSIANQKCYRMLNRLDVIESGNAGLITAVDKFDPDKGYRFSTYATWWIRQSINREFTNSGRMIRIPAHMEEKLRKVKAIQNDFSLHNGRFPTQEELSELSGIPVDKLDQIRKLAKQSATLSLEESIGEEGTSTLEEILEQKPSDAMPSVERLHEVQDIHDILIALLDQLNEKQRAVLILRFGLNGEPPLTLKATGERLSLTPERVRQIQELALSRLREIPGTGSLKNYL